MEEIGPQRNTLTSGECVPAQSPLLTKSLADRGNFTHIGKWVVGGAECVLEGRGQGKLLVKIWANLQDGDGTLANRLLKERKDGRENQV